MTKQIKRIDVKALNNKAHFDFMNEMYSLLSGLDIKTFQIDEQISSFAILLANENAAVGQIRQYEATDKLVHADAERDNIFRGMINMLKASLRHFDPEIYEAAQRLKIIFDPYGNIASLSYDEATSAISKLLQELETHKVETESTGIAIWINELRKHNEQMRMLMVARYSEEAARTQLHLTEIRTQINELYFSIVNRLEAGATLQGTSGYQKVFNEMNLRIQRYAQILSQEKGKRKKDKEQITNEWSSSIWY